jgi:prolyl-tRNA synthetase
MRLSQHFGHTLREAPTEAGLISHQLILRAGLGRHLGGGLWGYLPLGRRVIRRLESAVRQAIESAGGQEIYLPPASGDTSAHWIIDLARREVESYKDLPRLLYQIGAGREEATASGHTDPLRGGNKPPQFECWSLCPDTTTIDAFLSSLVTACEALLRRCGLDIVRAEMPEGYGFMFPHPEGREQFIRCAGCGYTAQAETALFARGESRADAPQPLHKVSTPDCKTIADLCAFLNISPSQTLKAVLYTIRSGRPDEQTVLVMLRGDLEVSEAKLMRVLNVPALAPATDDQIRRIGVVPGYASPIGIAVQGAGSGAGALVIADESLHGMSNFVTGANDAGYHMIGVNYPRDFSVSQIADIAQPFDGAACSRCGAPLHTQAGVELGWCVRLEPIAGEKATYLDHNGQARPVEMGYCRLGLERILAAVVETHHDDQGIIWPPDLAPFDVHLVAIARDDTVLQIAETLYTELQAAGLEVLYDDRNLSAGVMFADADLIGIPLRVTISQRSVANESVEIKWRSDPERPLIPRQDAVRQIVELVRTRH